MDSRSSDCGGVERKNSDKAARERGKRRGSGRRAARREAALVAATRVISGEPGTGASLQAVADALGVAHNSLYHYFRDRGDLYRAALERTVALRSQSLAEALGTRGSVLSQLVDYLSRELSAPSHSRVEYSGDRTLPAKEHARFRAAVSEHQSNLAALIAAGIEERSVADCNPLTRALALESILDRFIVVDPIMRAGGASRAQVAAIACDILCNGVLVPGRQMPVPALDPRPVEEVLGLAVDAEDAERAQLEMLLRTATDAFNREGWAASIPRMAAQLGKSKTVFYQYAVDKEDLLFLCYSRGIALVEASHRAASMAAANPAEGIVLHYRYLYLAHGSMLGPFPLFNARPSLKPQHRRLIELRNNGSRYRGQRRVERAIAEGWFRDLDPHIVQPLFGGMLYRVSSGYGSGDPESLAALARENTRLVFEGLTPRP